MKPNRNYADSESICSFSGRTGLEEYRKRQKSNIVNILLWPLLAILMIFVILSLFDRASLVLVGIGVWVFIGISIVAIISFFATQVRRCHDLGFSGWRFLVDAGLGRRLWTEEGQPFSNKYGDPPLDAAQAGNDDSLPPRETCILCGANANLRMYRQLFYTKEGLFRSRSRHLESCICDACHKDLMCPFVTWAMAVLLGVALAMGVVNEAPSPVICGHRILFRCIVLSAIAISCAWLVVLLLRAASRFRVSDTIQRIRKTGWRANGTELPQQTFVKGMTIGCFAVLASFGYLCRIHRAAMPCNMQGLLLFVCICMVAHLGHDLCMHVRRLDRLFNTDAAEGGVSGPARALRHPRGLPVLVGSIACVVGAMVGACVLWRAVDPAFGRDIPWFGRFAACTFGILCTAVGSALWPKRIVSFEMGQKHVAWFDFRAYTAYMLAIPFIAVAMGLALFNDMGYLFCSTRSCIGSHIVNFFGLMVVACAIVAVVVVVAVRRHSAVRFELASRGMTCSQYLARIASHIVLFGSVCLFVYELLVLLNRLAVVK